MGKILVAATVENLMDVYRAADGAIAAEEVRRFDLADAMVDVETSRLALPGWMIARLGLIPDRPRPSPNGGGLVTFWPVRLTIAGRDCTVDVVESPEDHPVVIGRIPLMLLDFVVDSSGRLIGNPAHGGEPMLDMFWSDFRSSVAFL